MQSKQEAIAWESRWATPTALATFLAVALLVLPGFLSGVSGSGEAEILRSTHEHSGTLILTDILRGAGFALLAFPLIYLFRAVRARSDRVRAQLIGLVVVAPLFVALSTAILGFARTEAADQFVAGEAKSTLSAKQAHKECEEERDDSSAKDFAAEYDEKPGPAALAACEQRQVEDDEASNAVTDASLSSVAAGLAVAGGLGFVIALFYSCLWAMRTGLLTRFWGSLGMALGVAMLLNLVLFTLIWFLYFALLIVGRLPGGRPPAWAAGEAIPWPTPGEKAAAELEPSREPGEPAEADTDPADGDPSGDGPPRKRKRRD